MHLGMELYLPVSKLFRLELDYVNCTHFDPGVNQHIQRKQ